MNNKGFTLIELLAVLAILAIIMLIVMPSVTGLIEASKKETFMSGNISMAKIAETAYAQNRLYGWGSNFTPGEGYIVELEDLLNYGYAESGSSMTGSYVVVYNNGGDIEYYMFTTDGTYYINGYEINNIEGHATKTFADFTGLYDNDYCDFTLVGEQLTYTNCNYGG